MEEDEREGERRDLRETQEKETSVRIATVRTARRSVQTAAENGGCWSFTADIPGAGRGWWLPVSPKRWWPVVWIYLLKLNA